MMVAFALTFSQSSYALPQMENENGFNLNKEEGSWFASMLIIGCIFGTTLGGFKCEMIGRRRSILIDCISYIIITIILSLAMDFVVLLVFRFLLGFVSSSAMVGLLMYSGEITQPQVQQITGPFSGLFFAFGISLGLVLGALFSWRWAFALGNFIPLVSFGIVFISPESPVWLMTKNREEEARQALVKLRGEHNTDIIADDILRMKANIQKDGDVQELERKSITGTMALILDPTFLKPFFVILLFFFCLDWGGAVPIQFYAVSILEHANVPIDPYWIASILAFVRVTFGIVNIALAKQLKRRILYFMSVASMIAATLMLAVFSYCDLDDVLTEKYPETKWIPVLAIFVMQAATGLAIGVLPYTLLVSYF